MIYIIKSESYRLLKNTIKKIIKDIDDNNIYYYDLLVDKLKDILEESDYNSLFDTKKVSIIYNTNIFGAKYEYKEDLELIKKYLDKRNDNIIIFIVDSISLKKSVVKQIKEQGNLYDLKTPEKDELNTLVKSYIKDNNFKIDNNALIELINRCNSNYDVILNEIDKVLIVKKDFVITIDDIKKYTIDTRSINVFDFVDKIIKKNISDALKDLDSIIDNIEPSIIFSNIANQYRLILSTKNLISSGYSEKDIANELAVHPYRIKLSHENSYNYNNEELINKLLYIGELDRKIKTGELDKNNALKLFLINI